MTIKRRVEALEKRNGDDQPQFIICWHGDEPCDCAAGAGRVIDLTWGDVDELENGGDEEDDPGDN